MVRKDRLGIDQENYQRVANNLRVLSISSEWSWVACGCLIVARRGDGSLYIIDGQHRKVAADKRADITSLPCLIFDVQSIKDEAGGFLSANTLRRPMRSSEKFKAQLACGDPIALKAAALIAKAGRYVNGASDSTTFNCLTALQRLIGEDYETVERIWPLLTRLVSGKPFHERILMGIFYLETHLPDGISLTQRKLSTRLETIGHDGLIEAINKAVAFYVKGGAKVYASGIVQAINYRSRSQLEMAA